MKILGINFSSRNNGNCGDIIRYCLSKFKEYGYETIHVNISDCNIESCGKCNYYCFSNMQCIKDDSITNLYRMSADVDLILLALPTFRGHLVSTYFTFSERAEGFFKGHKYDYDRDFLKKVNFIVVGNMSAGGDMALHEAMYSFTTKDYFPEAMLISSREYGRKSIDGNLIEDKLVIERYNNFIAMILKKYK